MGCNYYMALKRLFNWPENLHRFIDSKRLTPFKLGVNDCGLFAAGAVSAMTGVDLFSSLKGKYTDAAGEQAVLMGLVTAHNLQEVPVSMARRGDICLYVSENGPTALVVSGDGVNALGPGDKGLISIPVLKCSKAWRI